MERDGLGGRWRLALAVVLAAALAVRLAWGMVHPVDDTAIDRLPDQREYLELAENMRSGRGLRFVDPRFDDEVVAFRMPGYPAFVAMCGASVRGVRLAQAVVDTLSVLGVFILARRWLGERASVAAAGIVAVNPFLIYFTGLVLTETVFTAMLVWGMVLMSRGSGRGLLFGGLVLAGSVLVRPSGMFLPALAGAAAALMNSRSVRVCDPPLNISGKEAYLSGGAPIVGEGRTGWSFGQRPSIVGLTFLMLVGIVLVPWGLRNYFALDGRWVWTTTNAGFTKYDGFNPSATGASDQRFLADMPELRQMDEVERSRHLSRLADEYIWSHPVRVVELAVVKVARTWSPMPLSAEFGGNPLYVAAALLYTLPFYVLIVLGLIKGRLPRRAMLFLLIPVIYFTIIHAISVGSLRYRIPVEPVLAVLAASWLGRRGDSI